MTQLSDFNHSNAVHKTTGFTCRDSLFRFLFENEDHREWALSLFNALNGTDITDPGGIRITYSGNVLNLLHKDTFLFILVDPRQFFEELYPLWTAATAGWMTVYAANQYEKFLEENRLDVNSEQPIRLPKPRLFGFRMGDNTIPQECILRLSGLYPKGETPDVHNGHGLETTVHVLNIRSGSGCYVLERCKPLAEYAWIVSKIRKKAALGTDFRTAIRNVLDRIPEDFVIRPAIMADYSGVLDMLGSEAETVSEMKNCREAGYEEGRLAGKADGIDETKRLTIRRILEKNISDEMIIEIVGTTQETIDEVRKQMKEN